MSAAGSSPGRRHLSIDDPAALRLRPLPPGRLPRSSEGEDSNSKPSDAASRTERRWLPTHGGFPSLGRRRSTRNRRAGRPGHRDRHRRSSTRTRRAIHRTYRAAGAPSARGENDAAHESEVLKAAIAKREVLHCRAAEIGKPFLEPRVDRRGFFEHDGRRVAVGGEEFEPFPETGLEQRQRSGRRVNPWPLTSSTAREMRRWKVFDDGEEDPFLAVEVQVERAAGDAGAGDDVADARAAKAFAGEDPSGGVLVPPLSGGGGGRGRAVVGGAGVPCLVRPVKETVYFYIEKESVSLKPDAFLVFQVVGQLGRFPQGPPGTKAPLRPSRRAGCRRPSPSSSPRSTAAARRP